MDNADIKAPDALDNFLDEIDKQAQKDGYPPNIVRNMRHNPEMMDIIIRIIGAELQASKEARPKDDSKPPYPTLLR